MPRAAVALSFCREAAWLNGHIERLIGSVRHECLDHIVVMGEASLRRTLRACARHYNGVRTHRSLDKDPPDARPIQFTGSIYSRPVLGGLHHPSGSVHARATIRAPFAVIQSSSACSVNSPTKFSGMSAFRLSTISSAAARFSSDAGASLVLANVSSLGKGCLMQKINR
ncbi:MAG TPA: integrase core domain-containing protein [Reyranella sp.]